MVDLAATEESGRAVAAVCAEGGEARDLVGEGNAVENLSEGFAVKVAVESDDDDVAPKVLDLALYKEHEVVEELRFVDDDKVGVRGDLIGNLHEVGVGGVAGDAHAVVGDDVRSGGVSIVVAGFDDEDARPDAVVALDGGGDEGGLAGKHRTHNDFETHLLAVLAVLCCNNKSQSVSKSL